MASTNLPPACDLPFSPPTPPGPLYEFPELEDTTAAGQARMRATTGFSVQVGARVLCSVVAAPVMIGSSTRMQVHVCTSNKLFYYNIMMVCINRDQLNNSNS